MRARVVEQPWLKARGAVCQGAMKGGGGSMSHQQQEDGGQARTGFRVDRVVISSVLFTVALLIPVPTCVENALYKDDLIRQAGGFALLSNILVGLLVVWTGFLKRRLSAWFVMFVIVWVGAFSILVLPLFQHTMGPTLTEAIHDALEGPGPARATAEGILLFIVLLIALLLPIRSFFFVPTANDTCEKG